MSEPSKVNANLNSALGTGKETLGSAIGNTNLEATGANQRREGEAEYKAAQAQGYTEGTMDRAGGKVENVVGAVTGDKEQQVNAQIRHDKGQAKQEVNKP